MTHDPTDLTTPNQAGDSRAQPATFTAIMGPSGSGKSTLLHGLAAARADRVLFLSDGRVAHEMAAPTVEAILEQMKSLAGR